MHLLRRNAGIRDTRRASARVEPIGSSVKRSSTY
jgi:hypothetical protein